MFEVYNQKGSITMKKLLLVLLAMLFVLPVGFAEQKLTHFESVSAFTIDYPANKLHIVSDDSNTILRSPKNNITVMICIICRDDLKEEEPAAHMVKLAAEHNLTLKESDIPVFTTKGGGKAYQLRREDEDSVSIDYMIREGDRDFDVNVMLSADAATEYEPIVHDVVLSIAVNPDMPYNGAMAPDEG